MPSYQIDSSNPPPEFFEARNVADDTPKSYTAGTWGPTAAVALIERDGRTWYEDHDLD